MKDAGPFFFMLVIGGAVLWYLRQQKIATAAAPTSSTVGPSNKGPDLEQKTGALAAAAGCASIGLGSIAPTCGKAGAAIVTVGGKAGQTLGIGTKAGEIGALVATPVTFSTAAVVKGSQIGLSATEKAQSTTWGKVLTVAAAPVVLPTEGVLWLGGKAAPYVLNKTEALGKKLEFWNW